LKKYIKPFFRLTVTGLLIFYLFKKIEISQVLSLFSHINLILFLFASFLYIVSTYISTLRWKIFLSDEFRISRLFSVYLIGSFFNTVLPGIIGGDIIKVLMIRNKAGLNNAVASVFLERYTGFATLLMIGFVFFCIFYERLPQSLIIWSVPLSFSGFIVVSLFLYLFRNFNFLKNFYEYFLSFSKSQIAKAFLYSVFIQFIVILSVYVICVSLDIFISFFELCIYLPVIVLITTLPISVSGIGIREWCFILFFGSSVGQTNAVAISFLWFLSVILASVSGGIEYLRFKESVDMKKEKISF